MEFMTLSSGWVELHSCNTNSRSHAKAYHTWESLLATYCEVVPSNTPYLAVLLEFLIRSLDDNYLQSCAMHVE
mgnify:CR=1 FL=1